MRTISATQLADAIEYGGYKVGKKHLFYSHLGDDLRFETDQALAGASVGTLEDACPIGIGALNLGVGAVSLFDTLMLMYPTETAVLIRMNDKLNRPLSAIAKYVRRTFKGATFEVNEFDYGDVFENYQGRKI